MCARLSAALQRGWTNVVVARLDEIPLGMGLGDGACGHHLASLDGAQQRAMVELAIV